jgi:signal transduction histidine kinase
MARPTAAVARPAVPWRALVLDTCVALFLFLAALPAMASAGPWTLPLFAALTLTLVARRRYPVEVFAVVAAAALVQWLTLPWIGPYDLAVLAALYSVSAYAARRWSVPALVVGLVGAVMAWGTPWLHQTPRPAVDRTYLGVIPPLAVVTAIWLVGRNLRTRRRYLAELEQRAVRLERERDALARAAVAEERARIAREMHDVVAHTVAVMVAQAEGAGVAVRAAPEQAERALEVISEAGRGALTELRRMLGVLREPGLQAGGPQISPQPDAGDLDALVASMRESGLPVRFVREGGLLPADPSLGLAVYRIVQESLTNTLKHCGPSTPTEVVLRRTADGVEIDVVDRGPVEAPQRVRADGVATEPEPGHRAGQRTGQLSGQLSGQQTGQLSGALSGQQTGRLSGQQTGQLSGHGLTGMRERVALFAGQLTAGPTPTGGWRVHAVLPTAGAGS